MNQTLLTKFSPYYPRENRINPHVKILDTSTNAWIKGYHCLSEQVKQKVKNANYGILTAQIFPDTACNILLPIARWMLWAFVYDDLYGPFPKDELDLVCKKCLSILQGSRPLKGDNVFFRELADIRDELTPISTPEWMERFTASHRHYFEGLMLDEFSYKQDISYPSSEQYLFIRERLIGGNMVCDLLELVDGILPLELLLHPYIQRLRQLAGRLMIYDNDLFSYKKELQEKEAMNLVLILASERKISMDQAIQEVFEIRRSDFDELLSYEEAIPEFGSYNNLVRNYLRNVLILLQGQLEWYLHQSLRY
ncbi:terpene synthase family protein [Chitinophaga japonensis]|uniref:Terpene synthase n=1 Tax=Chitinophaga japonensis TaxID=104662 RepID=A0A562T294_CHIJA|nr:terpene synthase family protein [Chitinophaga japonensis]TWI87795.1 hypothetical protein LX66_1866 [Chitinophaga japonensis]